MKLVDVRPDGDAQNLADGIVRARYRTSRTSPALLTPGEVARFSIDLWATSHVFLPAHRMRVEISSSNSPRFDRNLNAGGDQATGTRWQTARQTIFHDTRYPSHSCCPSSRAEPMGDVHVRPMDPEFIADPYPTTASLGCALYLSIMA